MCLKSMHVRGVGFLSHAPLTSNVSFAAVYVPVLYELRPAFRDGLVAVAVDDAVDSGSIHFTSAGNTGTGWRFMSVRAGTLFSSDQIRPGRQKTASRVEGRVELLSHGIN